MYRVKRETANRLLYELGYADAEAWTDQKVADLLAELPNQTDKRPQAKDLQMVIIQIGYALQIDGTFELLPSVRRSDMKVVLTDAEINQLLHDLGKCNLQTTEGCQRWQELNGGKGVKLGTMFLYPTGASRSAVTQMERCDWNAPDRDSHKRAKAVERYWQECTRLAKRAFADKANHLKVTANHGHTPTKTELAELRELREAYLLATKNHAQAEKQIEESSPNVINFTPEQRREQARIDLAMQEQRHQALEELDALSRI